MIEIYTDGSCRKNGDPNAWGGWAFIILLDNKIYLQSSGAKKGATNQEMELTAAINGIETLLKNSDFEDKDVILYSDSAYLINCVNDLWYVNWQKNGWVNSKKQPVKNREVWERLIPFFNNPNFTFIKVKGHANSKYNNMVDEMAQAASKKEN